MKQIFTLCAATLLSLTYAFSQTSENFETVSSTADLEKKCWQFTGVGFQAAVNGTTIDNSNNLIVTLGTASFSTPYISLVAGTPIRFDYMLNTKLTGSATRTIAVSLLTYSGASSPLGTPVTLDKNTATNTKFSFSSSSPVTDVRKIVVTISSGNNSSDFIFIDNMSFGGSLNYNSPYNCAISASPLPIHLKSFQGLATQENVQLNWAVADNETGSYFEIEKSVDGKSFKPIAVVSTTQKSGDENYTYKDNQQASAYYRLKIVNNNKSVSYSQVLLIKQQASSANTLSLLQNPVKETLKFSFVSETNALTEIAVYNMLGVKVFQTTFQASKGTNLTTTKLDVQIKGGTYVLEVKNVTNRSIAKFLKD